MANANFGRKQGIAASLVDASQETNSDANALPGGVLTAFEQLIAIKTSNVIITMYMGALLPFFPLYVESIRRNPRTSWIFVHLGDLDQKILSLVDLKAASNFQFVHVSDQQVETHVQQRLNITLKIADINGYKLNDWKPLYGSLFDKWISSCAYWGYGDADVIYGNVDLGLQQLENESGLGQYKVVSTGHNRLQGCLSFFKTDPILKDFMEKHYTEWEWKDVGLGKIHYLRLDEFGFSDRISKYWRREDVKQEEKFLYNFNFEMASSEQLPGDIETGEHCLWTNGAVGCRLVVKNGNPAKLETPINRM